MVHNNNIINNEYITPGMKGPFFCKGTKAAFSTLLLFVMSHSSSLLYLEMQFPSARNIRGVRRSASKFHFTFVKGVVSPPLEEMHFNQKKKISPNKSVQKIRSSRAGQGGAG